MTNARFAASLDPDNAALISRIEKVETARAEGVATVPSVLGDELKTNPFLRADASEFKAVLGMADEADVDVFAYVRAQKDKF